MQVSKRERMMVLLMVVVVVVGFAMYATGGSGAKKGPAHMLPLSQAQSELVKATQQLKQMSTDTNAMQPRLDNTTYDTAASDLEPRIVRDLERIADKANVHLGEIKPVPPAKTKTANVVRVPTEVRFKAAFQPAVVKFLYYVESADNKMVVDKLDVTSTDARLKTVDVTAQISVFTRSLEGANANQAGES